MTENVKDLDLELLEDDFDDDLTDEEREELLELLALEAELEDEEDKELIIDADDNEAVIENKKTGETEEETEEEEVTEPSVDSKESEDISMDDIVSESVGYSDDGHSSFNFNSDLVIEYKMISIDEIIIPEKKKKSRTDTMIGLDSSIRDFGILNPIHVIKLEDSDSYLLLQGLRRLRAGVKNGITEVMAVIMKFDNVDEGKRIANVLDELINRSQNYSNREVWSNFSTLELVNGLSAGMLEFLLQLNAGDAMKLRDFMTSDYPEIIEEYMIGKLNIESAYKKLNTERSKEDKLMKENETSIEGVEGFSGLTDEEARELTDNEVDELLDLESNPEDMTLDELDMRNEAGVERQEVGNRRPLDPALRQAVLLRDEGTCQCCGIGGAEWLHVMDIHHVIQVSQGGADEEKNLTTVCINCHQSIHVYAWGKLKIDLHSLSDKEKETFKKILVYGNVIIKADKVRKGRGVNTDKDKETNVRKMPGITLDANKKALESN